MTEPSAALIHEARSGVGTGPHPTVVMLHGQGGDERSMWVFARTIPREWLVVAARGPEPEPGGGWSWRRWVPPHGRDDGGAEEPESGESGRASTGATHEPVTAGWAGAVPLPAMDRFAPYVEKLAEFVRSLPSAYRADPLATYLAGFSQGAAAAYSLALLRPGITKAVAGLYGFVPEGDDTVFVGRPLDGLRIFAASGETDPYISRTTSYRAVELLARAGADVESHEYLGGHKLPRAGLRDLAAWWRTI